MPGCSLGAALPPDVAAVPIGRTRSAGGAFTNGDDSGKSVGAGRDPMKELDLVGEGDTAALLDIATRLKRARRYLALNSLKLLVIFKVYVTDGKCCICASDTRYW